MKLFLIGLPGSGKSTLGPQLANALDLNYLDLDDMVVNTAGMPINEIFREKGEDYFRELENSILKEIDAQNMTYLLSTGGGTPCFFDAMTWINKTGLSIYLDIPTDIIAERIKNNTDRPLLEGEEVIDKLNTLHEQRDPIYRKSKLIWGIDTIQKPLPTLTEEIKKAV